MQLTETDLVYAVMHLHAAVVTVSALALDLVRLLSIHLGEDDDVYRVAGGTRDGGAIDMVCYSAGAALSMVLSQFATMIFVVLLQRMVDLLLVRKIKVIKFIK